MRFHPPGPRGTGVLLSGLVALAVCVSSLPWLFSLSFHGGDDDNDNDNACIKVTAIFFVFGVVPDSTFTSSKKKITGYIKVHGLQGWSYRAYTWVTYMPSVMYRLVFVFVFFQTFLFFSRVISRQRGYGEDGYGALARYNTT